MGNSKTPQSIESRRRSAKAFQEKLSSENRIEIRSKDEKIIKEIKSRLKNLDLGKSNAEKIIALINFWENNNT